MIKSFSVRHKLHILAPGLYDCHFVSIFQLIVYFISALLSLHMSFGNSVEVNNTLQCIYISQCIYYLNMYYKIK